MCLFVVLFIAYDDGYDYELDGPPGPPGPPGPCYCDDYDKGYDDGFYYDDKSGYVDPYSDPFGFDKGYDPYGIDIGKGYDPYNYGGGFGYGDPKALSGQQGYSPDYFYGGGYDNGYNNGYNTAPKKYDDGYDPSGYKLPNVNIKGVGGLGGIGGLGSFGLTSKLPSRRSRKKADEEKKFAKESEFETVGDAKLKTETKLKTDGYNDELAYAGAEVFTDAAANQEAFKKKEAFVDETEDAFLKESEYGGDAIYQNDDVKTDASVKFVVDHSLKFRNDFADENHRGSYSGNEFDVNYKASDVEGGFYNNELDRSKKASAFNGVKANGEVQEQGKFFGDEFKKYGDNERDLYYKAKGKGTPKGFDPKFGGGNGYDEPEYGAGKYGKKEDDLYSRFKGDKKGGKGGRFDGEFGRDYGPGRYEPNPPYGEKYRVKESAEKDDKYKGFGENFEAKDAFKKRQDVELYSGAEEKIKEKAAFDRGNYRDVNAKGSNKFASYAGDYQTNKKRQDVDFKVIHNEDLQQNLNQDVKSDIYFAKYNGEDKKFARDAERKDGIYTDAELKRKQDAFINKKAFNGNDFSNKLDQKNEADIYYGLKKDAKAGQKIEAKPNGYRPYTSRGRGRGSRKNTAAPEEPSDDERRSRMPRSRMPRSRMPQVRRGLEINNLRAQISSLKVNKIAKINEIIFSFVILCLAALIGAAMTHLILKFNGYEFIKEKKTFLNDDNECPMPN